MKVDVSKLARAEAGELKELALTESTPQLADVAVAELTVSGQLAQLGDRLLLKARLDATVQLVCARCLEAFELAVSVDLVEEFAEQPTDEQYQLENDSVDLAAPIRTALLLAIPPQPVHDPGCRGLCAVCGKNLNTDPHQHEEVAEDHPFAALEKLKPKPKKK